MRHFYRALLCVGLLLPAFNLYASHYLGGEMHYEFISRTSTAARYRVYFTIYQDCHPDHNLVIAEDEPAYFSVYNGNLLYTSLVPKYAIPPENLPSSGISCASLSEEQCIRAGTFTFEVTLSVQGTFKITNERCCLNEELRNVLLPTRQGITQFIEIPVDRVSGNSSPVFTNPPPGIWCKDVPFDFSLAATDPNGDSLSYRLVGVPRGGSPTDAKPATPALPGADLPYMPGHNPPFSFGTSGSLTLNAVTGELSGVCKEAGAYMVGVACDEWRKGILIGTIYRYYSYTFDECQRAVIADLQREPLAVAIGDFTTLISQCNGDRTVRFANTSQRADRYFWDFGDPGRSDDTSNQTNPSYTYPGPGTYPLRLIAYGNGCADELNGNVVIGDAVPVVDFRIDGGRCALDSLILIDQTNSGGTPVARYLWAAEGGKYIGETTPVIFGTPGQKNILHVLRMQDGCYAGLQKTTDIRVAEIFAGGDTTLVAGTIIQLQANGGVSYLWHAINGVGTELSDTTIASPYLHALRVTRNDSYQIIGKDQNGCRGIDTLNVIVSSQGYSFVPTAFSPNNDGHNDILHCSLAGHRLTRFSIYNRGGTRVFTTQHISDGWDGNYNDTRAPMATYYWMIEAEAAGGAKEVIKGDVFLMR